MKISNRTHPVLEKLASKDLLPISCFECDKASLESQIPVLTEWFKVVSVGINRQIYYLTKPFIQAYEAAGDKLFESNLWDQVEDENICLMSGHQATCMKIRNDTNAKIISCDIVDFWGNSIIFFGSFEVDYSVGPKPIRNIYGWNSENIKNAEYHFFNCILITLFIKYAEVQIKVLPANQRVKGIECKYINDTRSVVKILDSTWFTVLVKSDAFKVRGHFRLQPKKKNGVWTKELIWINEFQKEGYTRKAGKLNEYPE
jgi:hypothetical protein